VVSIALAVAGLGEVVSASAVGIDGAAAPVSATVNSVTSYRVTAHTDQRNERIQTTVYTFPANTDVSGVSAATVSGQDITNGGAIPILGVVADNVARTVTITTDYRQNQPRTDFSFTVGGVMNASQPGAYSYAAAITTNKGAGALTGSYTLSANASAVAVGAATLSTYTSGVAASYSVPITLGAVGRLSGTTAAGANTISVTFPAGYTLPASAPPTSVTLNGTAASAVAIAGQTVVITLPAALTLAGGSTVSVAFGPTFGLVNPVAGSYSIAVRTSAQTGTGTSPAYAIVGPAHLTLSIDTTSVDFGVIYPDTPTTPANVRVTVDCDAGYLITRDVTGDVSAMGLSVSGDASGAKPGGSTTVHTDTFTATMPWSTDPGTPLSVSVQYTVVRS
jgi:hypothetical protein